MQQQWCCRFCPASYQLPILIPRSKATYDDISSTPCVPNCSCAASIPSSQHCSDTCGGSCTGRAPAQSPTPIPGVTCKHCYGVTCHQLGLQTGTGTCQVGQFCCGVAIPLVATPTPCVKDVTCGANTPVGSNCVDSCGNLVAGRMPLVSPTRVPAVTCIGQCYGTNCGQLGKQSGSGSCTTGQYCCGGAIAVAASPTPVGRQNDGTPCGGYYASCNCSSGVTHVVNGTTLCGAAPTAGGRCTDGASLCSGGNYSVCSGGQWTNPTACPSHQCASGSRCSSVPTSIPIAPTTTPWQVSYSLGRQVRQR